MLPVLSTHLFLKQRLHPGLLELAARSGAGAPRGPRRGLAFACIDDCKRGALASTGRRLNRRGTLFQYVLLNVFFTNQSGPRTRFPP